MNRKCQNLCICINKLPSSKYSSEDEDASFVITCAFGPLSKCNTIKTNQEHCILPQKEKKIAKNISITPTNDILPWL